jgi:hypothetical protein
VLRAGSLLFIACLSNAAVKTDPASKAQVLDTYGKLPLTFEQNQGQTDSRVKFLARGSGYTLFLTPDSAVLSLQRERAASVLRMKLLGANRNPAISGTDALPGKSNYFVGNDPSKWRTDVPNYAKVQYRGVYPGIDLVYYGNQRLLEYDFLVAPGADPRAIELRFEGVKKLRVNDDGALVLDMSAGEVIEHPPAVYQEIAGQRRMVAGKYVLRGKGRVGFNVAEYDRSQPLIIDPTLVYLAFLEPTGGQASGDSGNAIVVDARGNAYVTGMTSSATFPTTPGTLQATYQGGDGSEGDAFVCKLDTAGTTLLYSTFLGGSGPDSGNGIAVDASGNAYVTGRTGSFDFPVTKGAFQTSYGGGAHDAFVSKLNAAGSALIYSTYLGGNGDEGANGIGIDGSGSAYTAGTTDFGNFPTTPGAFQTTCEFGCAFVSKLNADGSALVYSTLLGGFNTQGFGMTVDPSGYVFVTGVVAASFAYDFPTTPGAFQNTLCGPEDFVCGFVTKLNRSGSALVFSALLGGGPRGVAVDSSGSAYVVGNIGYSYFPTTPGAFQTVNSGNSDAFITKLKPDGSGLVYSTYLGGFDGDAATGIAVDAAGDAYVTGFTWSTGHQDSTDFPTTPDAWYPNNLGIHELYGFLSKLNADGSSLLYSTLLHGANGIAIDASDYVYFTGGADFGRGIDGLVGKFKFGSFATPVTTMTVVRATVTLSATNPGGSVGATYYKIDGGPLQTYTGPFSITPDGPHNIVFYSVDPANRPGPVTSIGIRIDSTKPVSHVAALPAIEPSPNFLVSWTGSDATSGVRDFTIYVSDNGSGFTPWLTHTTSTQAYFSGVMQHSYGFFSTARDWQNNEENLKSAAEATTSVPVVAGDVNGDGKIDCTDIAIVKASLGKKTGFDPRVDLNKDGVVDVRDLAIVAQKLPAGTKCP